MYKPLSATTGTQITDFVFSLGYLLDPHTSVAKTVGDRIATDTPMIITSTAHPGKFAADIIRILGHNTTGMKPVDMLQALQNHSHAPVEHTALIRTLDTKTAHVIPVCGSNYESIISQVNTVADQIV